MFKDIAKTPKEQTKRYLKYGFVITEYQALSCPACGHTLNAGPQFQPNYCSECGQKLSYKGIAWRPEKFIGYTEDGGTAAWGHLRGAW